MNEEEAVAFKRGSDLEPEGAIAVSCGGCGTVGTLPPWLCPDCTKPDDSQRPEGVSKKSELTIKPMGRHFAVFEDGQLLCIAVYRKGAEAVVSRLTDEGR